MFGSLFAFPTALLSLLPEAIAAAVLCVFCKLFEEDDEKDLRDAEVLCGCWIVAGLDGRDDGLRKRRRGRMEVRSRFIDRGAPTSPDPDEEAGNARGSS